MTLTVSALLGTRGECVRWCVFCMTLTVSALLGTRGECVRWCVLCITLTVSALLGTRVCEVVCALHYLHC